MFSNTLSSWRWLLRWRSGRAPAEERRAAVRIPFALETTSQRSADPLSDRLPTQVRDLSRWGVSLLVRNPAEVGDLLSVDLPVNEGPTLSTLLACVVRVNALSGGKWELGCTFSTPLTEEDLRHCSERHTPPDLSAVPDERRALRYPCRTRAFCQLLGDAEGGWPARVLNISVLGIGLAAPVPVGVGRMLSLELKDAEQQVVLTTLACVVRVTPETSGETLLGCNFISELSEKQLRALV
jgi:hypothetical protein